VGLGTFPIPTTLRLTTEEDRDRYQTHFLTLNLLKFCSVLKLVIKKIFFSKLEQKKGVIHYAALVMRIPSSWIGFAVIPLAVFGPCFLYWYSDIEQIYQ